jgi:beta-N-acetylhexosaminidase
MSSPFTDIGQHLFIGIEGQALALTTRGLLRTVQPGGVVLFARNIDSAPQLRELCRQLRRELTRPPLVSIDQEHGHVNRLRNIIGELPGIAALKESGQTRAAREFGRQTGRQLRELRLNMDFAPVLDLELFDETCDNALRNRCWGRTAEEVSAWAGAFLDGLQAEGVAGCAKHFPGLGASQHDSHERLPAVLRSREELLRQDIEPYRRLMGRFDAVMVGHGLYPSLDSRPASLSATIMSGLLRQQLGFGGLVVSDDLEMGAITQFGAFEDAVVEAFQAGADMMLVCHSAAKVEAAYEALARSRISRGRFAESLRRVQEFRRRWVVGQAN